LSAEIGQQVERLGFCRTGIGGRQYSEFLASIAVITQGVGEREQPAASYEGHHDVD
jgi:hypothetical protein